jgi:hypothetical protein
LKKNEDFHDIKAFTANKDMVTSSRNLDIRCKDYRSYLIKQWSNIPLGFHQQAETDFIITIYWSPIHERMPLMVQLRNISDYFHLLSCFKSIQQHLVSSIYSHVHNFPEFQADVRVISAANAMDNTLAEATLILDPEKECLICKSNFQEDIEIEYSEVHEF